MVRSGDQQVGGAAQGLELPERPLDPLTRSGPVLKYLRRTPRWRVGLTHIWCSGCARDLDWAQPEFLARHPEPRCVHCGPAPAPRVLALPAAPPVHAVAEVLAVKPLAVEDCRPAVVPIDLDAVIAGGPSC